MRDVVAISASTLVAIVNNSDGGEVQFAAYVNEDNELIIAFAISVKLGSDEEIEKILIKGDNENGR